MGQLRDPLSQLSQLWLREELRPISPSMEKMKPGPEEIPKVPQEKPEIPQENPKAPEENPKVRFSYDGFWTTQHPTAKAFSKEWFQAHLAMVPYAWDMVKMAFSVSKMCVFTVGLGTLGRALVDGAQLFAYTRFVHEVRSLSL